jgi:hypothetical protein
VASANGTSPLLDLVIAIDSSGSTGNPAGAAGTILQAEIAAVRALVDSLDPAGTRIAIVEFNSTGTTFVRSHLTSDFQTIHGVLTAIEWGGASGSTDFTAAVNLIAGEFRKNGEPGRTWVAQFLSDGFPTHPQGTASSSAIAAARRAAPVGFTMDTFGVGEEADPVVLTEMAELLGGRYHAILEPADILDVLPASSLVGIDSLTVENTTHPITAHAALTPDGGFSVELPVQEGPNEILVEARARGANGMTLECETDADVVCIVFSCPKDRAEECEDGGALVEGFAAEVDEPGVELTNDSPYDMSPPPGDADASGVYPLGATRVTFTAADVEAGTRSCERSVTVGDTLPPELVCPGEVTVGTGPDNTDCLVPVSLDPVVEDACDASPVVTSNAPALYPLGTTVVEFTAEDAAGNASTCETRVTVVDDTPPRISCPPDVVVGTGPGDEDCMVPVPLEPSVEDNCDPAPVVSSNALPLYPLGTTTVTFIATDQSGNSSFCQTRVTVVDDTPPSISMPRGREICIWPPNHSFHCWDSDSIFEIGDNCSAAPTLELRCLPDPPGDVSFNEPGDSTGDGAFATDCVIALDGESGLCVRAERQGNGPDAEGRVYLIGVEAQDEAGNLTATGLRISVSHSRGDGPRCARPTPGVVYGPGEGRLPPGYGQLPLPGAPGQEK